MNLEDGAAQWVAAWFDATGACSLQRRSDSSGIRVVVMLTTRTYPRVARALQDTTHAGRINVRKFRGSNRSSQHLLILTQDEAWYLLPQLAPYLVLKNGQVENVLKAIHVKNLLRYGHITDSQRSTLVSDIERIYAETRRLNNPGINKEES